MLNITLIELNNGIYYLLIGCLILGSLAYFIGVKYFLKDRFAFQAVGYSFAIQFLQLVSAICIIISLNQLFNFEEIKIYVVLFLIGSIIAIIPISIGGVGLREITFLYGAKIWGIENQTYAVSIAVVALLISIAVSLTGLPAWIYYNQSKYKE
jgi:uncharacterized membrane protein YbhN (UPF0104 family)